MHDHAFTKDAPDLLNQRVAMFDGAFATDPLGHPTIGQVLTGVRDPSPKIRKIIANVRAATDKEIRRRLKEPLPAITFAADLRHRKKGTLLADKLLGMSGLVCIDIDHLTRPAAEVRDLLALDPCCVAAFVSPSGDGVKGLFWLDNPTPERWARLWQAVADRVKDRHGLKCDPSRKDLVGLCFASHDPDIFIRSGPVELIAAADPQTESSEPPRSEPPPRSDHRNGPDTMRRASLYLANVPGAISKQGGHPATYAAATFMVHGFCLSESEAFDLLSREYNPRCTPPWSDAELWHKVREAATKPHDKPYGWLRDKPKQSALVRN